MSAVVAGARSDGPHPRRKYVQSLRAAGEGQRERIRRRVYGVANRDVEMMGRGRAPFTGQGLLTAAMNAATALKSPMSPGGLLGLGMTATGSRPSGLLGNLFGGNIQNIPGWSAYDRDLIQAVSARQIGGSRSATGAQKQGPPSEGRSSDTRPCRYLRWWRKSWWRRSAARRHQPWGQSFG